MGVLDKDETLISMHFDSLMGKCIKIEAYAYTPSAHDNPT